GRGGWVRGGRRGGGRCVGGGRARWVQDGPPRTSASARSMRRPPRAAPRRRRWRTAADDGPLRMGVMATPKIVLFYVFTPLADPEALKLWQHTLAESLGLKGRGIVSKDGINATVGGDACAVKQYVRATKSDAPCKKADIKWSNGQGDDFPRLSVKVRPELVTFGTPDEIKVTDDGVQGGGEHLKPGALHKLLDERGDDVVFFDGRNAMEAQIGK